MVVDRHSDIAILDISGNAPIETPDIDALGNVVTFWTTATSIQVGNQTLMGAENGSAQVYAYNLATGVLTPVSATTAGICSMATAAR